MNAPSKHSAGVEAAVDPNRPVAVGSEEEIRVAPDRLTQPVVHNEDEYHHHLATYIKVAVILAAVTAVEVFLSYMHLFVAVPNWLVAILMLVGMAVKFALVALFFMHLKSDNPALSRFLMVGIIGAVILYIAVLFSYNVFTHPRLF